MVFLTMGDLAPASESSAFDLIVDTNFTHIDLDGDGKADLVAGFSKSGITIPTQPR
ncbi:MAG: hypothetical protein HY074_16050 [Deltaproteobacteria bacterium]|nr:hypothetical protein [Deltaproteobacteria bacterium]